MCFLYFATTAGVQLQAACTRVSMASPDSPTRSTQSGHNQTLVFPFKITVDLLGLD
jgi:hypothetical protein